MASEVVQIRLVDDIDGKSTADETVRYTIDGVTYEIDLTKKRAAELRAAFLPYITKSRRIKGAAKKKATTRPAARKTASSSRAPLPAPQEEIRAWAKKKRMRVPDRGRLPNKVIEAFLQAA